MFISLNVSFLHSLLGLPGGPPAQHLSQSTPFSSGWYVCRGEKGGQHPDRLPVLTPPGLDMEASPHHLQTKAYVRQFQVIDNQNLLFELSYKLEANSQ